MIDTTKSQNTGSPVEVFATFLKLGLTSFGGPIAHIGYFRTEVVERRSWINDDQFSQLLAICQFLPGPASSQLGFCLGMHRAGWLGALAAFLAFTLPSVLLLLAFASALPNLSSTTGLAVIHGLKLVAVAVVAHAVLGMSKTLCPDTQRRTIAVLVAAILIAVSSVWVQLLAVIGSALMGIFFLRDVAGSSGSQVIRVPLGRRLGSAFIVVFGSLLIGLPLFSSLTPSYASVAEAFYRTGALVFGGGHVVLPLLQDSVVTTGWVTPDQFLAGYGASQAIPGPMFAFSAYLGSVISAGESTYLLATIALIFMFLPGFLLVTGVLPFWRTLLSNSAAKRGIAGANAGVVGLLASALYNPIFTAGIASAFDLSVVIIAFGLLAVWRASPLIVVSWCVSASILSAYV